MGHDYKYTGNHPCIPSSHGNIRGIRHHPKFQYDCGRKYASADVRNPGILAGGPHCHVSHVRHARHVHVIPFRQYFEPTAAQQGANVDAGTEKGNVIATIGIAVSNIVSLLLITGAVLGGSALLAKLPANVVTTLNYILPALFGGIFGQFFMKSRKLGVIAISLAVGLTILVNLHLFDWLPFAPYNIVVIVAVFGTMFVGKLMADKEVRNGENN